MTRSTLEVRDDGRMVAVERDVRDELKRRSGAYELLPSNRGAVVLRRQGSAAAGQFWVSGEITRLGGLWGVMAVAAHSGWRGELVVAASEGPRRSLFIEHGAVISALSEAPTERLGAVLERSGALTPTQVAQVLEASTEQQRFGETAVTLGFISRERLYERIADQVRAIFYAVLYVDGGSFYFTDGFDEAMLVYRVHVEIDNLLMDGMNMLDQPSLQSDITTSSLEALELVERDIGVIVGLFNQAIALVHQSVAQLNVDSSLNGQLDQFAEGNATLTALQTVRRPDGSLSDEVAACIEDNNLSIEEVCRALHDCATFAVFLAESVLRDADPEAGTTAASELARRVTELTMPLSPKG